MQIITVQNNHHCILNTKSTNFESLEELKQYHETFKEMKQLLKSKNYGSDNHNGLGLALPQVGINKRGFVFRQGEHYEVIINPKILKWGNKRKIYQEGCFSIPNEWYLVERSYEIDVVYRDINMNIKTTKLFSNDAEIFQHEYDHLDGILISDIGMKTNNQKEFV